MQQSQKTTQMPLLKKKAMQLMLQQKNKEIQMRGKHQMALIKQPLKMLQMMNNKMLMSQMMKLNYPQELETLQNLKKKVLPMK